MIQKVSEKSNGKPRRASHNGVHFYATCDPMKAVGKSTPSETLPLRQ